MPQYIQSRGYESTAVWQWGDMPLLGMLWCQFNLLRMSHAGSRERREQRGTTLDALGAGYYTLQNSGSQPFLSHGPL